MSTATQNAPDHSALRNFLLGKKQASSGTLPTPESTIEGGDGGKTPTTGARFAENSADVKKNNKKNVEDAPENEDTGRSAPEKLVPNSGLEQTTSDREDSQTRAIKTVKDENDKIASLDLSNDADLATALASLAKAAAALPGLIADSGVPVQQTPTKAATETVDNTKWAAEQQAIANTVAYYHKMGSDRGRVVVRYLLGHDAQMAFLKQAEADGSMEQMMAAQAAGASGGAGGGGDAPPPMPTDPAAAGDASAMPPMDAPGAGTAPPDAGGGDPGAAGGGAISPEDMANALAESGMTPQELEQVLEILKQKIPQADMPEPAKDKAAAMIEDWSKLAGDTKSHMRSGKFTFKPAADGTPARKSRDVAKGYLQELRRAGQ